MLASSTRTKDLQFVYENLSQTFVVLKKLYSLGNKILSLPWVCKVLFPCSNILRQQNQRLQTFFGRSPPFACPLILARSGASCSFVSLAETTQIGRTIIGIYSPRDIRNFVPPLRQNERHISWGSETIPKTPGLLRLHWSQLKYIVYFRSKICVPHVISLEPEEIKTLNLIIAFPTNPPREVMFGVLLKMKQLFKHKVGLLVTFLIRCFMCYQKQQLE